MDKLPEYMSRFLTKGAHLLCSGDDGGDYSRKVQFEKSFICGSFWAISGLTISQTKVNSEDLFKVLKTLKLCMKEVEIGGTALDNNHARLTHNTNSSTHPALLRVRVIGFSEFTNHSLYDCNVQSTLYALQVYYMAKNFSDLGPSDLLPTASETIAITRFVSALYDEDTGCFHNSLTRGSFSYTDLRHMMAALCAFTLGHKLVGVNHAELDTRINSSFNQKLMLRHLKSHFNTDGGISLTPGGQSHSAGAFCCLGSLILIGKINSVSSTRIKMLIGWILDRISVSGGMNGRVGKSNDVCYIWWNLAALVLIKSYYSRDVKLFNENVAVAVLDFLKKSQNEDGGFSCNKSNPSSDPYHSFTAILSHHLATDHLNGDACGRVDVLYALPSINVI